ncbi:MAG: rhomboid family intramembrane serine protease [Rubripirellula sp.]
MGLYDRDYGREEMTPWERSQQSPRSITITLIVVNVVIYFVDLLTSNRSDGQTVSLLAEWLAVSDHSLTQPWKIWQCLTYGFLHDVQANFPSHLIFNMIGLFVFGRDVENKMGRMEFLRFYLIAVAIGGLVGALTSLVMGGGSTIGASGAVIATALMFACYFPNRELLLMLVIPVKAWVLAVFFVMADFAGAFGVLTGMASASNTAFTVHLAGAGFALAYYFLHWNLHWLSSLSEIPHRMRQRSRRMKLKLHDPDKKIFVEAEEADRILGKIHESGEESLTASERKTLERYSRRQRAKRDQ